MKAIGNETRQMAGANAVQNHVTEIDGARGGMVFNMSKEDKIDAIVDTIADVLRYAELIGFKNHSSICRLAQHHVMDELEQEGK